jgi:hypothetical protein
MGITYSAKDDRYYTIGEFTGDESVADGTPFFGAKALSPGTGIVAFDPTSGAVTWARSAVKVCPQVLYSFHIGSLIAQSGISESLYFACVSGGGNSATFPGTIGLVRMHIDPKGDSVAQLKEPFEYFAISGNYFAGGTGSGVAAFDATNERFYLQSLSFATPGAWVFDGRLTAWVGFVSAPNNADYYIGINERMGHLYMGMYRTGGDSSGMLVADVRQTPVPAGESSPIVTTSLIATDSMSNRMFARPLDSSAQWMVLEDTTPVTTPGDTNEDYDALTSTLPDSPSNDVDYALGATGFGAEAIQVGGVGAPYTGTGNNDGDPVDGVSPSTRAVMSARVGSVDLRPSGAAASAEAFTADAGTLQEYETSDHDVPPDGKNDIWPYETVTCLDAGGRPSAKTAKNPSDAKGAGAHASISCDLGKNAVTAKSSMSETAFGALSLQDASYDVSATRDAKAGAQITSTAVANGAVFNLAGGFAIHFGKVVAKSTSVAHGHTGTATSAWSRSVSGVWVSDALGSVIPIPASGCASSVKLGPTVGAKVVTDTCGALADSLNDILPTRFHAQFPMPSVIATPKGAFSAVEQTDAQYFQETTVNDQGVIYRGDSVGIRPAPAVITEAYTDTAERSRTVTVLAATQSNAKFTISPPYDDGFVDGGGTGGGTGGTTGTTTPVVTPGTTTKVPSGTTPTINQPPQTVAGSPVTELRGFLLLRRSLRDTALLVLLSGLMLGGCGTAWRRRRLVDVLVTVPRKEAAL